MFLAYVPKWHYSSVAVIQWELDSAELDRCPLDVISLPTRCSATVLGITDEWLSLCYLMQKMCSHCCGPMAYTLWGSAVKHSGKTTMLASILFSWPLPSSTIACWDPWHIAGILHILSSPWSLKGIQPLTQIQAAAVSYHSWFLLWLDPDPHPGLHTMVCLVLSKFWT